MSSPSALLKVNCLVMRCLHFVSVLGDLQEGHVYGKRLRGYTFQCHSPSARAQKPRFCARKARKQGFQTPKAHKNLNFVLERAENEGFEGQKRTKMQILCSGMVAASSAALPRALRGASGSSAPGNRLPQPTTQPAAVHATGNYPRATCPVHAAWHTTVSKQPRYLQPLILPCIPPWRCRRGATAKNYRRVLPPRNYRRATCPPGITTARWVPRPAGG